MLNKSIIMGRLTRDPEVRYTNTQVAVANFTLAVDRDGKDKTTGEKVTDFIDCSAFGKTAEHMERFFTKGRVAIVDGRIQTSRWEDSSGQNRKSTFVLQHGGHRFFKENE